MVFDSSNSSRTSIEFHLHHNPTYMQVPVKQRIVLARKIAKDLGAIEAANGSDYAVQLFVTISRELRRANWLSPLTPFGVWMGIRKKASADNKATFEDLTSLCAS